LQTRDHVGDENIQHRGQDRRHQVEPVGGAEQEQAGPAEQGPFAAGLAEFIGADRDRDGVIRSTALRPTMADRNPLSVIG
jgi:hypothetical protein